MSFSSFTSLLPLSFWSLSPSFPLPLVVCFFPALCLLLFLYSSALSLLSPYHGVPPLSPQVFGVLCSVFPFFMPIPNPPHLLKSFFSFPSPSFTSFLSASRCGSAPPGLMGLDYFSMFSLLSGPQVLAPPAGVGWTATGRSGRKWHGPGLFGFYSVIFLFQSPPSPSVNPALHPCSSPLCLGGVGAG